MARHVRRMFPLSPTSPIIAFFCFALVAVGASAQAQVATSITPTSGTGNLGTTISQSGNVYGITGGNQTGSNLFHSFGQFNVGAGDVAQFQTGAGPNTSISNILGRVTGQQSPSQIFGTIDSATFYPAANLFMMNPYGFLFGPTASVNVGGMVAFTSADYLRLQGADGGIFYADPTQPSVLTTFPVAAFGFLGSNPGAITVQGSQFALAEGTGISLVGGNITVQSAVLEDGVTVQPAHLSAPGGQINLASVASPGEVLNPSFNYGPNVNGAQFTSLGTITLSDGALVDVSANQAGAVQIRGGELLIADATVSADTANANGAPVAIDINVAGDMSIVHTTGAPALTARTTGIGDAGEVRISSNNLTVTSSNTEGLGVTIDTHTSGEGRAGNVNITTGNLDVSSSSGLGNAFFIDSGTAGFHNAHGGDVTITANSFNMFAQAIATGSTLEAYRGGETDGSSGNVNITANDIQVRFSQIWTDAGTVGDAGFSGVAGDITLDAKNITLEGSNVTAFGFQRAGTITMNADVLSANLTFIDSGAFLGPGGINITAHSIELTNATTVVSDTAGDGDAGPINITATDHLTLSGNIQDELPGVGIIGRPTGIFSNAFGVIGTNGNAGTITITTPKLVMTDGARINTTTQADGNGGNVIINAQSISMSGILPSIIPEPLFSAGSIHPGGIVTVTTGENCAGPCGNAGNISITTNQLTLEGGAQINSGTSSSGHGGTIAINATDTIAITGTTSGVASGVHSLSTGTAADSGAGGSIKLTAGQSVTMSDGAFVSASSTGPGSTGNIQINAGGQFAMTNASVTTEANQSSGGAIKISTNPNGTVQLTDSMVSASVLDGTGGGGSVNIDPQYVLLQNSQILANAVFGPGGNISITTNLLLPDVNSVISASSQFGQQGTVTIQSPNAPASGKILPLGKTPLVPVALLTQRCAALAGSNISSFTMAARDSIPTAPTGWLASPLSLAPISTIIGQEAQGETQQASEEIERPLLSLRRIAPPGFLTQSFAMDSSAGCTS